MAETAACQPFIHPLISSEQNPPNSVGAAMYSSTHLNMSALSWLGIANDTQMGNLGIAPGKTL